MTSSLDPELQTVAAYDAQSAAYAEHSRDRAHLNRLHAHLVGLAGRGATVLDLGCGAGHDAAELASRGLKVMGLDLSRGLLLEACAHGALAGSLIQADARRLPTGDARFAGVWACASLLHVPRRDVGHSLVELFRVLKPGGVLFTSMSEGDEPGAIPVESDGLSQRLYYYHRAETWAALVAGAGFEIIDHRVNRQSGHFNPGSTGWIETFARKP